MARKKSRIEAYATPHEVAEATPCEECLGDALIILRARELEAEQGHARNIVESFEQERELEAMWGLRAKVPKKK
jgi:hypothetical protein